MVAVLVKYILPSRSLLRTWTAMHNTAMNQIVNICVCVRAWVRGWVGACVCACVCVCVNKIHALPFITVSLLLTLTFSDFLSLSNSKVVPTHNQIPLYEAV
jgi:hypothetical protein